MLNVYCVGLRDERFPETMDSYYGLTRIAVARDEAHARELWRAIVPPGDGIDDVDSDDELLVVSLSWEWPLVPEPERPTKPCLWIPGGSYHGLELWRGYGLASEEEDVPCSECSKLYPRDFVLDVSVGDDGDEHECDVCKICVGTVPAPWGTP